MVPELHGSADVNDGARPTISTERNISYISIYLFIPMILIDKNRKKKKICFEDKKLTVTHQQY